jgi:hypothetical protein
MIRSVTNTVKISIVLILAATIGGCGGQRDQDRASFLRSEVKRQVGGRAPSAGELKITIKNSLSGADLNAEIDVPTRFRKPGVVGLLKYSNLLKGTILSESSNSYIIPADEFTELTQKGNNLVALSFNDSRASHDGFMPCVSPNDEISVKSDPTRGHFLTIEITERNEQSSYTCHVEYIR